MNNKKKLLLGLCTILGYGCDNVSPETITLITGDAENITTNSVTVSIEANNVSAVNRMGVAYSMSSEFVPSSEAFALNISKNEKVTINGLEAGTMYFYKAFASDRNGNTVYGNNATFTTESNSQLYSVTFKYTHHPGDNDRFFDDVKKINLYVFDQNNILYTTMTELSPYDRNFKIPLELQVGTYHIIAWGNVLDSQPFTITPAQLIKGVTTFAEARLILEKTFGELNDSELEKLFWGEITTEIPLNISKMDTISLVNNTKRIRVVLHWDYKNLPQQIRIDHQNVVVRIRGTNAKYRFHNDREVQEVTYAPFHAPYNIQETDSILQLNVADWQRIFYSKEDFRIEHAVDAQVYDFTILRFFQGVPLQVSIEYRHPQSDSQYTFTPLVAYYINDSNQGFPRIYELQRSGMSNKITTLQSWTDYYDCYRVDINITQIDFDTFETGGFVLRN